MGLVPSRDGPPDAAHVLLLRALERKASCRVALQQQGEIEAGSEIHGYVEIDVEDWKLTKSRFDDRERYKYSYNELKCMSMTHFNRIEVELISEINTRVRYKRPGHGSKKIKRNAKFQDSPGDDSDSEDSDNENHADADGNMYAGHIVDSSGGILETNVSNRHLAVERTVLYNEVRLVAMSAASDSDALFGNLDSFQDTITDKRKKSKPPRKKEDPDEVLTAGKHRFPFTFTVPEFAPSTCGVIRSYSGDNVATILTRLVVKVQMKDDLDEKGVGPNFRLEVHSVPVVIRSLPPKDPALGSSLAPVGAKEARQSVDASGTRTPIYDTNGALNENSITTPLFAAIVRGDDDETSSLASGTSATSPVVQPFVISTRQMVSCWCLPFCAGSISLQARSEKFIYCLDEPIQISWEINNLSRSKRVKQITIELVRRCQWKAKGHSYESELNLAQVCRNDSSITGGGSKSALSNQPAGAGLESSNDPQTLEDSNIANICCPPSDPTSILCCSSISTSLFSVTYFVKVVAKVYSGKGSCCVSNPSVIIPLHMYSRFSSEMNIGTGGGILTGRDGKGSRNSTEETDDWQIRKLVPFMQTEGRYDIKTPAEQKRFRRATDEFNNLFTMYDGLNYVSHEETNIVAPLSTPARFVDVNL